MKRLRTIILILLVFSTVLFCAENIVRFFGKDHSLPEITCTPEELYISAESGENGLLQGVTAWDERDGDLTGSVVVEQITGTGTAGQVTVTYAVSDSSHHIAACSRRVIYTDYVSPRFSLSAPLIYEVGEDIRVRDRLNALDMIDGLLSDRIKMSAGSLSAGVPGTYPVTFEVSNSLGDTSALTLDIVIRSSEHGTPQIYLTQYLLYLKQSDSFNPTDYIDSVSEGDIEDVTAVFPDTGLQKGLNQITYSYTGNTGLTGTTILYVVVE